MSNKWKNTPTLDDLKSEVVGAEYANTAKDSRIISYRDSYREAVVKNVADRGSKKIKSNYRSRIIEDEVLSASSELQYHITNPSRLFSVSSVDNNADSAKEHSLLLHKQFDSLKSDLSDEASTAFAIDGTLCLKTGWKLVEKTTEVIQPVMSTNIEEAQLFIQSITSPQKRHKLETMLQETGNVPVRFERITTKVISENTLTISTVNPLTLLVDPKAKKPSDIQFVVEIHETDYISLVNSKGNFKNLKALKRYIKNSSSGADITTLEDYDPRVDEEGMFEYSDMAKKKFTVHEYWGYYDINNNNTLEPIVAMWVDEILIRLERSPYPFKELPYDFTSYYPVYGSIWGTCIPDRLSDEQKSKTGTFRAIQDITDTEASDQEFVDTSIFVNDLQISNYKAGKTVYLKKGAEPARGIYKRNTFPVSGTLFDQLELYNNNIVNKTGNFTTDQMQYTETTAGNSDVIDGITYKKKSVIRRFLNIFEAVGRKVTKMNSAFILEGDTKYSDDRSAKTGKLCPVDIGLLQGEVFVSIDILTTKDADAKAAKIVSLMNTAVGSMSEDISSMHYMKIAELWGMYDLAEGIEQEMIARANYQPSEEELELKRLEIDKLRLDNDKIRLEILLKTKDMENTDSIMLERLNRIEIGLEEANKYRIAAEGKLSEATAGKYDAQTQLFNQSFDLVDSGTKRKQEERDAEYQHTANLEREKVRTDRELELMHNKYNRESNKDTGESTESKEIDPIIEYIKNGTINNDSYDTMDHVYRNILDTSPEYTKVKENSDDIVQEATKKATEANEPATDDIPSKDA